jgi:beta-lactamase regulating signal transducer with metallopeptidase domain
MTTELLLSSTPGWLLDVALQTTVLLALAGGVTACLPRLSAARRHFIHASVLLLIPVIMLSSFIAPAWRISRSEQPRPQVVVEEPKKALKDDLDPFSPSSVPTTHLIVSAEEDAPSSPLWALLWIAGLGAGAVSLGFSALALRRLKAASRSVQTALIKRCFQEETAAFHVELPDPCLRTSTLCQVPMTWGLSHPTVLLPEQAAEWSEPRLRLVLRHELAHIARGDILVTLLTTLAALLLWFHPLVWLMLRASHRSREQACDDLALAHSGQSANDFAEELLAAVAALGTTARPWLPLALAVSASAKAMRQRLVSLVQAGRSRRSYSLLQKLTLLLPAMAAAFALAGLSACRKPEPAAQPQILIRSRVISIPKDSPVLAEAGLTLDVTSPHLQSLGILNAEQTNDLLHKVSQQKGVDLMSAPSVTTRSGQKATMEVTREFIYPSEFEPPKQATDDQPVMPTTPTAFEMRPVGVRMEVVPISGYEDNIDITVTPEVTSFEGFIDYGSPITHLGKVVSENKVQQPIFHSLKTTASFHMKSGQSIVFGGLGSPDSTALTSRMPKSKDLIFFVIEASILDDAQMTPTPSQVAITTPQEPSVTVFGQVKRQGKYVLKPGMTVQDLLNEAEGLADRADATQAELKRGPKLAPRTFVLDLSKGSAKPLEDGDALTIPGK